MCEKVWNVLGVLIPPAGSEERQQVVWRIVDYAVRANPSVLSGGGGGALAAV
jgi:hypothetical protein